VAESGCGGRLPESFREGRVSSAASSVYGMSVEPSTAFGSAKEYLLSDEVRMLHAGLLPCRLGGNIATEQYCEKIYCRMNRTYNWSKCPVSRVRKSHDPVKGIGN
jgi:hypothetical protein